MKCKHDDCDEYAKNRGLCRAHYPRRPILPHPSIPGASVVQLTAGLCAVIDSTDADAVGRFDWCSIRQRRRTTFYARKTTDSGAVIGLHQFLWALWGMPAAPRLDHADGDGLNCRRGNVRVATAMQNGANRHRLRNNTSGIKGVSWNGRRWAAAIRVCGKAIHLGLFMDKDEAGRAYEQAAHDFFGEFARTA